MSIKDFCINQLRKWSQKNKKELTCEDSKVMVGEVPLEEIKKAQDFLGVSCARPGLGGEAIIVDSSYNNKDKKSIKKDKDDEENQSEKRRSISYIINNLSSGGREKRISNIFRNSDTKQATILIRMLRQGNAVFLNHIQNEMGRSNSDHRRQSLELIKEWAFPENTNGIYGNDLLVWAPSHQIIPNSIRPTASLGGHIVMIDELGDVIRSVIYGNNSLMDCSGNYARRAKRTTGVNPIWYSCPSKIIYRSNYCVLPDNLVAVSYWKGLITKDNIESLMTLGDLLLTCDFVDNTVWVKAILRIMVPLKDESDKPDFSSQQRALLQLGRWDRVTDGMVEECFKAFIPGSKPISGNWRQSLGDDEEIIFSKISHAISVVGDPEGTTMLGVMPNGRPLIMETLVKKPGILFLGPTKNGKTTLMGLIADTITQNVILVPCSREEYRSDWIYKNGGTVIVFAKPDADQVLYQEGVRNPSPDMLKERQEQLFVEDKDFVKKFLQGFFEECKERGRVTGLPITFEIKQEAGITRFYNFISMFIEEWEKMWGEWHIATGERCYFAFDNYTNIPSILDYRSVLGDIPKDVAKYLHTQIKSLVSMGTNFGCGCMLSTSSAEDLSRIGGNFIYDFNLRMNVTSNSNGYFAYLFSGPYSKEEQEFASNLNSGFSATGGVNEYIPPSLISVLNVTLPSGLLKRYERTEFQTAETRERTRRNEWNPAQMLLLQR